MKLFLRENKLWWKGWRSTATPWQLHPRCLTHSPAIKPESPTTEEHTRLSADTAAKMGTGEETGNYTLSWNISAESSITAQKTNTEQQKACELYKLIVSCILMGILCLAGIIGNILSFIVFWKDKIKTSTSFLFQGLSFIDTCLLVTGFPLYVFITFVDYTSWWPGYDNVHSVVLVFVFPLAMMSQTTTIWVTVLVGINRYIAVCKPYQASRLCTVQQARKQLAIVILISCLYSLPKFFEAKLEISYGDNKTHIAPNYTALGFSRSYKIIYNNIFYMIFMLILPLVILTILNIRLINALKEIKRRRAEMQSLRQQQDNNVTFVLIIVVLVFTVCQAPALVNQILWNVLPDTSRQCGGFQFYYSRVCNFLVMLNSSVNFVIYFLFNTKFRQVLVQLVCKTDTYHRIRIASTTNNCRTDVTRMEKTEADHKNHEKCNHDALENHDHDNLENGQADGTQLTLL